MTVRRALPSPEQRHAAEAARQDEGGLGSIPIVVSFRLVACAADDGLPGVLLGNRLVAAKQVDLASTASHFPREGATGAKIDFHALHARKPRKRRSPRPSLRRVQATGLSTTTLSAGALDVKSELAGGVYMLQTMKRGTPARQSAAPLKSCGRLERMSSALRTSLPPKLTISLAGS